MILEQVPNRTRKVGGVQVNFIAKFDIDEFSTDLTLEAKDYDTSYSAGYESWMLLESSEQPTAMDDGRMYGRGCSRAGAVCMYHVIWRPFRDVSIAASSICVEGVYTGPK